MLRSRPRSRRQIATFPACLFPACLFAACFLTACLLAQPASAAVPADVRAEGLAPGMPPHAGGTGVHDNGISDPQFGIGAAVRAHLADAAVQSGASAAVPTDVRAEGMAPGMPPHAGGTGVHDNGISDPQFGIGAAVNAHPSHAPGPGRGGALQTVDVGVPVPALSAGVAPDVDVPRMEMPGGTGLPGDGDDSLGFVSMRPGYVRPFFLAPADVNDIDGWRVAAVSAAAVSSLGASYIYLTQTWWDEGGVAFHFDQGGDLKYALNLDKAAHFYGGHIAADAFYGALRWAGMSDRTAAWTGFGFGSFVQAAIEMKDGFAPRWGFSPWDVASGMLGSLYFVGRQYSPIVDAVDFKLSYFKRSNRYYELKTHGATWNDDYVNQTYWASIRVNQLLPASVEPYWPDWLAIAVGVGVDDEIVGYDVDKPDVTGGHHEVYLALDVDLREILPSSSAFWEAVKYYLNYIKFPAPAVRLAPGVVWFGLYF